MPRRRARKNQSVFKFDFLGTPDMPLLYLIVGLTVFGIVMVFNTSFNAHSNSLHFVLRQTLFVIFGGVLGFIAYSIDYRILSKFIIPAILGAIVLLIAVLIPGVGTEIQGASRWIDLKVFNLQPSEVAKLAMVLYLSAWASKQKHTDRFSQDRIKEHITNELVPFLCILGLISALILAQPDLATTGLIGMTSLAVYFLSGRDAIHTLGTFLILIVILVAGVGAAVLEPYRLQRVQTYYDFLSTGEVQDPLGSGYQLRNVLIAVGSGGLTGVGFGESRQKFAYLGQTAHTDNIFAVYGEELGFVGTVTLTCLFFYFLIRGLNVASRAPDKFGQLLAAGISIMIVLQAFLHIGTNIGLIPVTGLPLPFISYGGSSIVITLISSGLLLNVSRAG